MTSTVAGEAGRAAVAGGTGAPDLVARAEANLAGMEGAVASADVVSLERWDLEFHALLAEFSGNKYLLRLSKSINHVFADRRAVMAIPGRAAQSISEHHRIFDAVRVGDAPGAAQAMTAHITSTKSTVLGNQARATRA